MGGVMVPMHGWRSSLVALKEKLDSGQVYYIHFHQNTIGKGINPSFLTLPIGYIAGQTEISSCGC